MHAGGWAEGGVILPGPDKETYSVHTFGMLQQSSAHQLKG